MAIKKYPIGTFLQTKNKNVEYELWKIVDIAPKMYYLNNMSTRRDYDYMLVAISVKEQVDNRTPWSILRQLPKDSFLFLNKYKIDKSFTKLSTDQISAIRILYGH